VTAKPEFAPRRGADHILVAIVFAALMLALPTTVKLAAALGADVQTSLARRLTMVLFGLFVVYTGNAMPKMLTPLSRQSCDAARVQAFQRFAGRVWVATGLLYTGIWIALPIPVANPLATMVLVLGTVAVAARLLRVRRGA
jgi:hypothetical protein